MARSGNYHPTKLKGPIRWRHVRHGSKGRDFRKVVRTKTKSDARMVMVKTASTPMHVLLPIIKKNAEAPLVRFVSHPESDRQKGSSGPCLLDRACMDVVKTFELGRAVGASINFCAG